MNVPGMKWLIVAFFALSLALVADPALAKTHGYHDIVTFGNSVTVAPGENIGDLVVFGGSAEVQGHVHGDAVIFGGSLHIAPEGQVDGDTVSMGGSVNNESRARPIPMASASPEETPTPIETPSSGAENYSSGPSAWTIIVLLDALLTLLAFALFPVRSEHSLEQIREQPLWSIVLGFLSPLILVTVVVILAVTVIGIPLMPVALGAYFVAYLIGKAGIALFLGQRFIQLAKVNEPRPIVAVMVGLVILLLITGVTPLWFAIPVTSCIGCVAVGAALVSFIRARPFTGFGLPAPVAPTPAPAPASGSSGPPAVQ